MEISFDAHPDRYRHWRLAVDGEIAHLTMSVSQRGGLRDDYELKLNSYDLSVDIELADAVQRIRFEHPDVSCVVVDSALDRVFCAGANIPMLSSSTHSFKVNFCKFTNETRLYIEDASRHSGIKFLAALNGACAGGGYELALACDEIMLIDDGNSAVSLPEVPLLAVLPGTGGLTRLVDKRMVRRDLADIFCTTSEGVKGKRAVQWDLVDAVVPRSKFEDAIKAKSVELAAQGKAVRTRSGKGISLPSVAPEIANDTYKYEFVDVVIDRESRKATLTMSAPTSAPSDTDSFFSAGADQWAIRAFREIDDALLRIRQNLPEIGLLIIHTRGDAAKVLATDAFLDANRDHWLVNETLRLQARVLRRLDMTSRSVFAIIDEGSCFAGSLLELAFASDRSFMLEDDDEKVTIQMGALNMGSFPTATGLSRLEVRFFGKKAMLQKAQAAEGPLAADDANSLGLITIASDDIDWEDDVRIAIEERASMSPDALTGMEASLRFPGPETVESKIFARLSAWQNWIFQRPNAVGPEGALTKYGQPDRPKFDWRRC